ncbi:TPA: hypothetical protein NGT30_002965 [Vibrio parahaemolyticus]|nr:hypothetical protein [Vibrio parahaemolyticus]HCE4677953.1 hypothetical protein [Vibrio parahaemolyticus]
MTKNNLLTVAIRKAMVCAVAPTVAVVALSANAQTHKMTLPRWKPSPSQHKR